MRVCQHLSDNRIHDNASMGVYTQDVVFNHCQHDVSTPACWKAVSASATTGSH